MSKNNPEDIVNEIQEQLSWTMSDEIKDFIFYILEESRALEYYLENCTHYEIVKVMKNVLTERGIIQ